MAGIKTEMEDLKKQLLASHWDEEAWHISSCRTYLELLAGFLYDHTVESLASAFNSSNGSVERFFI